MSLEALYRSTVEKVKDGKRYVDEEHVIVGSKGIKIKYFCVKDTKKEKIVITGKDGEYLMRKTIDGEVVDTKLDNKGLSDELKSPKLKFAKEYLKDIAKGGSRKPVK